MHTVKKEPNWKEIETARMGVRHSRVDPASLPLPTSDNCRKRRHAYEHKESLVPSL